MGKAQVGDVLFELWKGGYRADVGRLNQFRGCKSKICLSSYCNPSVRGQVLDTIGACGCLSLLGDRKHRRFCLKCSECPPAFFCLFLFFK